MASSSASASIPSLSQPPLRPQLEAQSHPAPHPPSSVASSSRLPNEARKPPSTAFSFRRPFRPNPNPSSTTVVPSTAEGKPIPVDDSTAENRTSALRELNNNYPSRHRFAKSTGAQSSTYSEPVIVRSYYSPQSTRPEGSSRRRRSGGVGGIATHARSVSGSDAPGSSTFGARRALPFANHVAAAGSGVLGAMARAGALKPSRTTNDAHNARLPPVEAFSFKSFMSNMEAQASESNISADLDRIAEICAKSRYSLSNQYEVHYAPHGSGTNFWTSTSSDADNHGPTLQVVPTEDERSNSTQRKRRIGARRNSRAMGTLETIMSSSRSSDEDKSKKKSAAEIAEDVRGRAARKTSSSSSPHESSTESSRDAALQGDDSPSKPPTARRPSSLALIDNLNPSSSPTNTSKPRAPAASLVGEIALPQASTSQLEIRTAPDAPVNREPPARPRNKSLPNDRLPPPFAKGAISSVETTPAGTSVLSTLGGWMPWKSASPSGQPEGRAEGSLRELLKTTNTRAKSAEALPQGK